MTNYSLIFFILFILVIPSILFGIYWYFITKMGWNNPRLFALSVAVIILIGTLIIWIFTRSALLLVIGLLVTLLQFVAPLFWNVTSPELVKLLTRRK